jgi:hypothetical protein
VVVCINAFDIGGNVVNINGGPAHGSGGARLEFRYERSESYWKALRKIWRDHLASIEEAHRRKEKEQKAAEERERLKRRESFGGDL